MLRDCASFSRSKDIVQIGFFIACGAGSFESIKCEQAHNCRLPSEDLDCRLVCTA